jgi:putative sigma-54 modulation protein
MKVSYTGKQKGLLPAQVKKLGARIAKVARLVDIPQTEREAHVILSHERHLICAEVTVSFFDHKVVGASSDTDQFTAISDAFDKLEKQILKLRTKWRDTKRGPKEFWGEEEEETENPVPAEAEMRDEEGSAGRRVFRADNHTHRKPMTMEEALLEIEQGREYVVYRDAESDRLSVLVRRRDGNYDLIEA